MHLFAELPTYAEIIPEVQQRRFFKRALPKDWQDRLAVAGDHYDKLTALVLYFERLENRDKVNSRDKSHNSNINNQTGGKASRFTDAANMNLTTASISKAPIAGATARRSQIRKVSGAHSTRPTRTTPPTASSSYIA